MPHGVLQAELTPSQAVFQDWMLERGPQRLAMERLVPSPANAVRVYKGHDPVGRKLARAVWDDFNDPPAMIHGLMLHYCVRLRDPVERLPLVQAFARVLALMTWHFPDEELRRRLADGFFQIRNALLRAESGDLSCFRETTEALKLEPLITARNRLQREEHGYAEIISRAPEPPDPQIAHAEQVSKAIGGTLELILWRNVPLFPTLVVDTARALGRCGELWNEVSGSDIEWNQLFLREIKRDFPLPTWPTLATQDAS